MELLIDLDTLKSLSLIHGNVENDILTNSLIRSQDMVLQPIIGSSLYKRLLAGVLANDLTVLENTLIDDYIAQVISIAVEIRTIDVASKEIRNVGYAQSSDASFQIDNDNGKERGKDISNKDLEFYKDRLRLYLDEKRLLYPLYDQFDSYGVAKEGNTNSYSYNFAVSLGNRKMRKRNYDDPNCYK